MPGGLKGIQAMDRSHLADLAAFVAVADQLSFRGAATRRGVTPSALSYSMRRLGERLDMRRLNRPTRSVSPSSGRLDCRSDGGADEVDMATAG
jgi:hypothetical protein